MFGRTYWYGWSEDDRFRIAFPEKRTSAAPQNSHCIQGPHVTKKTRACPIRPRRDTVTGVSANSSALEMKDRLSLARRTVNVWHSFFVTRRSMHVWLWTRNYARACVLSDALWRHRSWITIDEVLLRGLGEAITSTMVDLSPVRRSKVYCKEILMKFERF